MVRHSWASLQMAETAAHWSIKRVSYVPGVDNVLKDVTVEGLHIFDVDALREAKRDAIVLRSIRQTTNENARIVRKRTTKPAGRGRARGGRKGRGRGGVLKVAIAKILKSKRGAVAPSGRGIGGRGRRVGARGGRSAGRSAGAGIDADAVPHVEELIQ